MDAPTKCGPEEGQSQYRSDAMGTNDQELQGMKEGIAYSSGC